MISNVSWEEGWGEGEEMSVLALAEMADGWRKFRNHHSLSFTHRSLLYTEQRLFLGGTIRTKGGVEK